MNLPRWLSPVRTVEAETGWPRAVCEEFARTASRGLDLRALAQRLALVPAAILLAAVVSMLFRMEPPLLTRKYPSLAMAWDLGLVLVLYAVVGVPIMALCFATAAGRARRLLRRYLPEPWCFKCKYPIPPPREGRSYSVCPECGEPIPPEIAALAAQRARAPYPDSA